MDLRLLVYNDIRVAIMNEPIPKLPEFGDNAKLNKHINMIARRIERNQILSTGQQITIRKTANGIIIPTGGGTSSSDTPRQAVWS